MSHYLREYIEKEHPELYRDTMVCSTAAFVEVKARTYPKWYLAGGLPEGVDEKYLKKSQYKWVSEKAKIRVVLKRIKNIEAARKKEMYYVMHYKLEKLRLLYEKMFGDTPATWFFNSALWDAKALCEDRSYRDHDFMGRQLKYLAGELKAEHINLRPY